MALSSEIAELPIAWREQVVGLHQQVPLFDGRIAPYINLDNAATTPALQGVVRAVEEFLPWYASVHRGSGFKSRMATAIYDEARQIVGEFFGAGPERVVVFGKNATEALNKLAARFPLPADSVVLTTMMEHHSNMLPWRSRAEVDYIDLEPDGTLSLTDLEVKLARHAGRVKVVTVTGASNVTGFTPPIHKIAAMAHAAGAAIVVDAAQLAPHRAISMRPLSDPEHIDFLVASAHKMYAPYGTGVLVGPREPFLEGEPDLVGGGTVKLVTLEEAVWLDPPEKEEAGSPNAIGVVAFAAAIKALSAWGMDTLAEHERELTTYALRRLREVPGLRFFGSGDPERTADRLGVISFNLAGYHHGQVAAVLGHEFGIGVRNGCFCAHPYLLRLLEVRAEDAERLRSEIVHGVRARIPGSVRISFGFYNIKADVDAAVDALKVIASGQARGTYRQIEETGEFVLEGKALDELPRFGFGQG